MNIEQEIANMVMPLPFDADDVMTYMTETFGVNPTDLYCSVTGRPYGNVRVSELEDTIRFLDNPDLESFCDDLFVRMIAGMRPCLNWSRVEPVGIEFARTNDPAGLLSYLVHRVNESKPSMDMTFAEMMDRNQTRIKTYRKIADMVAAVDTFELTQLLLQADSLGNLHRFRAPKYMVDKNPVVLFSLETLEAAQYGWLVKETRAWVESILTAIEKESRVAMADARAAATYGNRLTRTAYTRSWMEKPVSALTPEARTRQADKATGERPAAMSRKIKKVKAAQEIDDLFAQVAAQIKNANLASKIAASPKPASKPVLRFGKPKQGA